MNIDEILNQIDGFKGVLNTNFHYTSLVIQDKYPKRWEDPPIKLCELSELDDLLGDKKIIIEYQLLGQSPTGLREYSPNVKKFKVHVGDFLGLSFEKIKRITVGWSFDYQKCDTGATRRLANGLNNIAIIDLELIKYLRPIMIIMEV